MKKILFAALPVMVIALMALKPNGDTLTLGSHITSPETKMKDVTGKEVSLNEAKPARDYSLCSVVTPALML
ncbi:MAG: hypothetical protein IPP43_08370 [Chitinophagaceae bacterium]|nr:hypothetical protein [Chitinophagaceae bacterium]